MGSHNVNEGTDQRGKSCWKVATMGKPGHREARARRASLKNPGSASSNAFTSHGALGHQLLTSRFDPSRAPAAEPQRRWGIDGMLLKPCLPSPSAHPPVGTEWLHEIKHDGFRLFARRDGERVRLITRGGYDWSDRYSRIAAAVLPVWSSTSSAMRNRWSPRCRFRRAASSSRWAAMTAHC